MAKAAKKVNKTPVAPVPVADPKPTRKELGQIGYDGSSVWGGYFQTEYLTDLRCPKAYDTYDEMRRGDAQAKMLLRTTKNPILGAKFKHDPISDDDKAKEAAEFCDWHWFKNPFWKFPQWISEVLTFCDFGFSLFEYGYKVYDHSDFGMVHVVGDMAFRNQKSIQRWMITPDGLQGVEQMAMGDTVEGGSRIVQIPVSRLCVFTNDQEGETYEGISMLRAAYGAWFRKQHLLKMLMIGAEKAAIGTPIGKYPAGAANDGQKDAFEAILSNFTAHESSYLMVPQGYEIDFSKNQFDADKLMSAIAFEDGQISKAFMMSFLELGQNGNGGSYSLGSDLSDIALNALQFIGNTIASKMHEINEHLVEMNFGDRDLTPDVKVTGINDKASKELADTIKTLIDGRVIRPDDSLECFLRDQYNLPKAQTTREDDADEGIVENDVEENTQNPAPASRQPDTSLAIESALNGAQVASLLDVVDRVGRGYLPKEAAKAIIMTAFNQDARTADAILSSIVPGSIKDDPVASNEKPIEKTPETAGAKPKFSEDGTFVPWRSLTVYEEGLNFAESAQEQETANSAVANVMKAALGGFVDYVMREAERRIPKANSRLKVIDKIPIETKDYEKRLLRVMAEQAKVGYRQADRDLASKLNSPAQFAEKSSLEFLPPHVQEVLKRQAKTQAENQAAEIKKILDFGMQNADVNGLSDDQALYEIEQKLGDYVQGPKVDAGARTIASQSINYGRNGFFFDDNNLKEVQGFQYSAILDDRTTDICLSLDGKTFSKDDPDAERFRPPNHNGCRSILVPITLTEPTPKWTGLQEDPSNPALVDAYAERGKPTPDLAKIKKSRNL